MSRRNEGYGGQVSDDIPRMYRITTRAGRLRFLWDGRGMMMTRIRGQTSYSYISSYRISGGLLGGMFNDVAQLSDYLRCLSSG